MNAPTSFVAAGPSLSASFSEFKAAQGIRDLYESLDDQRAASADYRAFEIQGDMIAAITRMTGLTADQIREVF